MGATHWGIFEFENRIVIGFDKGMGEITITELARALGLGKSTVQRVLSGAGKVSEETRERVLEKAKEMGYKRNLYFAALASQRKRGNSAKPLVHYVNRNLPRSDPGSMGLREADYLKEYATKAGLEFKVVDPAEEPHPKQLPKILWHQGTAGVLLGNCGEEFMEGLDALAGVPVLNLMTTNALPYNRVGFDVAKAVHMCWQKLREHGYRRIGCAVMRHFPENNDDRLRYGAALVAVAEDGDTKEPVPPLFVHLAATGEPKMVEWLKQHKPEAVIGFGTGGFWICREVLGKGVPYVALHAGMRPESSFVPGVRQPLPVHAENSIRVIDTMIRHADCGVPSNRYSLLIDPMWHDGVGIDKIGDYEVNCTK